MPDPFSDFIDPAEVARLRKIRAAAKEYVAAQRAIFDHRRDEPEGRHDTVHWIAHREELAERLETAQVALASLVGEG